MLRLLTVLFISLLLPSSRLAAEGPKGEQLFQNRCGGCHSLDADKIGPRLRGVFGNHAAASPNFNYSAAVKNSHLHWNEQSLDKWLADPDSLIPDSDMAFRLENSQERAAIIDYLKQVTPHK